MNLKVIIGLVLSILVMIFIAFFVGFNLDNTANFSFVFKSYENVSVLFIFFIAFIFGIVFTLPFVFLSMIGRKVKVVYAGDKKEAKKAHKKELKNKNKNKNKQQIITDEI